MGIPLLTPTPVPTGYNLPDARFEMPELLTPGRKPVGAVKIDWSHPLAKDTKLCVIPDKPGNTRNIIDGVIYTRNSNQSMVGSATGFASYTSSDKHYLNNTSYTPLNVGTGDCSMMIVVAVSSSSGAGVVFIQRNNAAPFNAVSFRVNNYIPQGSNSSTDAAGAVYFGGFDTDSRGAFITSGGLTGAQQVFVGTRRDHLWSLYGDGLLLATYDGAAFPKNVSSGIDNSSIGGFPTATTSDVIGNIYSVVGWARGLSDVEAFSLSRDPYQFLIPA